VGELRDRYSIKSNLQYMGWVFYRPKSLIEHLSNKPRLFQYTLLALIIFTVGYEILYIWAFISQQPNLPIVNLLRILTSSEEEYHFWQIILFPVVHLVDYILFWMVIVGLSRLFLNDPIDAKIITWFGMFT